MQLGLPFGAPPRQPARPGGRETVLVGRLSLSVAYVRHRRARHYIIHVEDDGSLRVTIPRGGSRRQADEFVAEKAAWIERERYRAAVERAAAASPGAAPSVRLHGEDLPLAVVDGGNGRGRLACFGGHRVGVPPGGAGASHAIERYLRRLAAQELPARLLELAGSLGRGVAGVTVRGQRTRWGSCSPAGRISLNWRLVQLPASVSDYVLLHELTHLVHLNHSKRFWRELERVCPWHREARAWLRSRGRSRAAPCR